MSQTTYRFLVYLGLVVILVSGLLFGRYLFFSGTFPERPTAILEAMKAGNYGEAKALALAKINDPSASAEEKAHALRAVLGVEYRMTGDPLSRIQEIQQMKAFINDPSVSPYSRAYLIGILANTFSISGRNTKIFDEIFKDEPYRSFLIENDPDQSSKQLAEWSYELAPNSYAAILIARWYTEQPIIHSDLDAATRAQYIQAGEEFLKKADVANERETELDPNYPDTKRYITYRYWRTIIISRLAKLVGEPYAGEYRIAFEDFIDLADSKSNVAFRESAMRGRLEYALRLYENSEIPAAEAVLTELSRDMNNMSSQPSVFFDSIFNEFANNPLGERWTNIKKLTGLSQDFKGAVETVIGGSIQ